MDRLSNGEFNDEYVQYDGADIQFMAGSGRRRSSCCSWFAPHSYRLQLKFYHGQCYQRTECPYDLYTNYAYRIRGRIGRALTGPYPDGNEPRPRSGFVRLRYDVCCPDRQLNMI